MDFLMRQDDYRIEYCLQLESPNNFMYAPAEHWIPKHKIESILNKKMIKDNYTIICLWKLIPINKFPLLIKRRRGQFAIRLDGKFLSFQVFPGESRKKIEKHLFGVLNGKLPDQVYYLKEVTDKIKIRYEEND